jgi:hypothetical protein
MEYSWPTSWHSPRLSEETQEQPYSGLFAALISMAYGLLNLSDLRVTIFCKYSCSLCMRFDTLTGVTMRVLSSRMSCVIVRQTIINASIISEGSRHNLRRNCGKIYPCNRPWRPIGLWDVEAPTFSLDNKNLLVSLRWVLYSKTDWPTDRRS